MTKASQQSWRTVLWLALSFLVFFTSADLNNETSPTYRFKSRPDIHAPIIDLIIHRPELVSPGYLFLAPYRNLAPGPYIYDNYGELVWAGAGETGPKTAHIPHVCQYKGRDHLCYFQGDQHHGYARGFGVIMDNSYRIVKSIGSSGAGASSDMHEFRLTPHSGGSTALVTVYQPRPYDLTVNLRFNMQEGVGWIIDGVFQEVDLDTGDVLFEWRSLDHVDPSSSWVMPGATDTSGNGLDSFTAWDYFHINSVDKNKQGDYLISSRHASTIFKVSGRDGDIMWQLGGIHSDFELIDFKFGYQHEARWFSENSTHTLLSFFDNSGNAFNYTSEHSQGVIVSINHIARTANIIKSWGAPEPSGGLRSASQGNMQLLPNGGALICWGEHARFSEHSADGSTVMYGSLALRESNVMMYRSHKYNWTAQPVTKPAIWTFSKSGDDTSRTRVYISWNGATEVRSWRFYTGNSALDTFQTVGTITKQGFETEHVLSHYADWVYADALDAEGQVLASSAKVRTFVPSSTLAMFCDERDCQNNQAVPENDTVPYDANVETESRLLSMNRGYDTRQYYVSSASPARSVLNAVTHGSGPSFMLWTVVLLAVLVSSAWYLRRSRPAVAMARSLPTFVQSALGSRRSRWSSKPAMREELEMLSSSSSTSSGPAREMEYRH